jgi:hypothetical protein
VLVALDRMPPTEARLSEGQREGIAKLLAGELRYLRNDPKLGWALAPGGESGDYRANAQGFRADREHPAAVLEGRLRIAAFGDSFTHGDEVAFANTWQEQLAAQVPGLDVLNFGVPGYGPGQALLRYEEEAQHFELPVALFAVMTQDIKRGVNRFLPFLNPATHDPMAKPRFLHEDGQLRLLQNPLPSLADYRALLADEEHWLPRIGERDYFYARTYAVGLPSWPFTLRMLGVGAHALVDRAGPDRPMAGGEYNEGSEAFAVLLALCERFREEAQQRGTVPVVVMLPLPRDMRDMGRARHTPLVERLEARGTQVIDTTHAFADRPGEADSGVIGSSHYNAAGNAIVARALRAKGLLPE